MVGRRTPEGAELRGMYTSAELPVDWVSTLPAAYPELGFEEEGSSPRLAWSVWILVGIIAAGLIAVGATHVALMVLAACVLIGSLIQHRVALYALIMTLPIEWMVVVLPNISSVGKVLGLWALLLSVPLLVNRTASRWDPCAKWIVALVLWSAIGSIWAIVPLYTLTVTQSIALNYGLPFLIVVHLQTRRTIRTALILVAGSCLISALAVLWINDVAVAAESGERAATQALVGDSLPDANGPSRHLALGVITCLYLLLSSRRTFFRFACVAAIMPMAAAILMLKGRAVYLSLPAALVGGVVMLRGVNLQKRLLLLFLVLILGVVAAYALMSMGILGTGIQERFESIFEEGASAGSRRMLWMAHFNAFISTGFRGAAMGSMHFTAESNYHVAHNDLMNIIGELGIVGLVCFVAFHVTLVRRVRRMDDVQAKMYSLMAWLLIVLCGMTENDWYYRHYTMTLGFILALVHISEAQQASRLELPDAAFVPQNTVPGSFR